MAYEDDFFVDTSKAIWNFSLFTEEAIIAFQQGILIDAYRYFGAHPQQVLNVKGYYFSVWAPHAKLVSVVGEFNGWNPDSHQLLARLDHSGIWEGFIPNIKLEEVYKYNIVSVDDQLCWKADPFAFYAELRPQTASKTWQFNHQWQDEKWMKGRKRNNSLHAPWNVYELHLGSWMRPNRNDEESFNSYKQLETLLVDYINEMGFTHVEFMPIMEHPYDKSWGYQCTGFFAATSRFGKPDEFMGLIDALHQAGIGVILDWVPSHFPGDAHGLYKFDGAHTYEYADMSKGFHPDWNSYIFNYKRGEVKSFLISSARFWLDYFHVDGLRVDAVNSIIRLDFSRPAGTWEPNEYGGRENIEAIEFLKSMNYYLYRDFPDIQTIAEEASDWPGITSKLEDGGFGFGMKWMMGWMHDSFRYFKTHHHHRPQLQNLFTFSMVYFYNEKFMLPLSHDEIVHGKSPMLYKMPGLEYEKFATLRVLYAYMYAHPGAKLMFMGNEFGQTTEWNESSELDWHLLQHDSHQKLKTCVAKLSHLYKSEPALHELQFETTGFEWILLNHQHEGVMAFKRKGKHAEDELFVVLNISDKNYPEWAFKVYGKKTWKCLFNSDDLDFWGKGTVLNEQIEIKNIQGESPLCEIKYNIPALSVQMFK
jgi:1,4-alpha-glucan branching enzyme